MSTKIYLSSDLHIDHWDKNYISKYPCGKTKNEPYIFKKKKGILIIAGDISDSLDLSINYLNNISENFDKILFIDGNHEHISNYPNIFSDYYINFNIDLKNNNKIQYLKEKDFFFNDTVIIGCCGWWNYDDMKGNSDNYFKGWIKSLNNKNSENIFMKNVIKHANLDYEHLKNKIEKYNKDDKIKNIIIVTHTVPKKVFARDLFNDCNTKMENIISYKIKYWLFGHNHEEFYKEIDGIKYISNPRGRPEDNKNYIWKPIEFKI